MLEDNQFVLSHVRNGVNEARRLFADQKLRVDRSMAAGEDAREAQQTLGLIRGVPLNLGETQRVFIARKEATSGDLVTPPGYAVLPRQNGWVGAVAGSIWPWGVDRVRGHQVQMDHRRPGAEPGRAS